jgi:predicted acylesterase/phospholipase RssA
MATVWCLSGGAIKGTFQVGAALALHLQKPELAPDAVAGTSVGAINALAFSGFDLPSACAVLLNEYLALTRRQDMYELAPDFRDMLAGDAFAHVTTRRALAMADDASVAPVFELLLTAAEGEFSGVLSDAAIGAAIGGVALAAFGPFGLIAGALTGGLVTGLSSSFESFQDAKEAIGAISQLRGFYTLSPVATRLARRLAAIDVPIRRAARFESIALEDGKTYAIDENARLRIGLDTLSLPTEQVELEGERRAILLQGILGSAAIPLAFQPSVVALRRGIDLTLLDGGVRNELPVLSTLDLLHDRPNANLVVIANSPLLTSVPGFTPWPVFAERSSSAYDFRPHGESEGFPAFEYFERVVDSRPRDGTTMGRALLQARVPSMLVIEPTLSILRSGQVDPGLIRIWIAYGYLRASDALQPAGIAQQAFRWSSDWITAARRIVWGIEDVGGPLALALNRTLLLAVRALLAERASRAANSVPPDADALAREFPGTSTELADLVLDGSNWLPRDPMFADGIPLIEGARPFATLRGQWPRLTSAVSSIAGHVARVLAARRVARATASATGSPVPPDLADDAPIVIENLGSPGRTVSVRPASIPAVVFPEFEVRAHTAPSRPFPLWLAGSAISTDGSRAVIAGVNPFDNSLILTDLKPDGAPPVGSAGLLAAFRLRRAGVPDDPLVGVLDNVGLAARTDRAFHSAHVVRGASGNFYISHEGWQRVGRPAAVDAGRRDVPNEGHACAMLNDETLLIATQASDGSPIFIETDLSGRTSRYRTGVLNWPEWPFLGTISRSVIGSRLPAIALDTGAGGGLVQAADGYVWWIALNRGRRELTPELVRDERFPFVLTGSSYAENTAVLAGMHGDVLRRFVVRIGLDGSHTMTECPRVPLAVFGLSHCGRALAAAGTGGDVIGIVPVESPAGPSWAWVSGCNSVEPRTFVSNGLGNIDNQ